MKAPIILESKECQLEIAARAKARRIVVPKPSVHKAFKDITVWLLLIIEINGVNMMALQTRL